MGGVSAAGFLPGFGLGGTTHSLLVKIEGICIELDGGPNVLLVEDEDAGARACGDVIEIGDDAVDMLQ